MIDNLLPSTLLAVVPLLLAATGGAVNRRAGIVNIGLEGQMLIGALVGAIVSGAAGNWVIGLLAAAVGGGLGGLLMSLVITRLRGNEIIVGLGFSIAAAGLVGYLLKSVYGVSGTLRIDDLDRLPVLTIPGVDGVPVLGALVSGKDPLFWLAVALVPVLASLLRRSAWGLRLRASGADEDAARSLGLPTRRIRDGSSLLAGVLAGLAGAYLVLGQVGLFNKDMTGGRGYIALAAFYFGRSKPWPTAAACLVFALFDAIQIRLQPEGAPTRLVQTLPYVAVVVVLAITGIRQASARSRTNGVT